MTQHDIIQAACLAKKGVSGDISELDARVTATEENISTVQNYAYHAARMTQRDITNDLTNLKQAIAEQDLAKYGYAIGDYFDGASGYRYFLADLDTFYGGYNNYAVVNTHHVGVVVDTKQDVYWNERYNYTLNTSETWDSTKVYFSLVDDEYVKLTEQPDDWAENYGSYYIGTLKADTSGGYVASTLHEFLSGTALDTIRSDFAAFDAGLELLAHSKLYTNAATNWAWSNNQYISALTEEQVYGMGVFRQNGYNAGEAYKKLNVFSRFAINNLIKNKSIWLRSVWSAAVAADVYGGGGAYSGYAYYRLRAVGLILIH